ncbi:MAG: M36 family metallopeptidase, partial [Oligoflexales bacterium]|nr:M36 family metallopeptidase [Oligoflexales bacterium]
MIHKKPTNGRITVFLMFLVSISNQSGCMQENQAENHFVKRLREHPALDSSFFSKNPFAKKQNAKEAILSLLEKENLPSQVKIVSSPANGLRLAVSGMEDFSYFVNENKICDHRIQSRILSNQQLFITGDILNFKKISENYIFPLQSDSIDTLKREMGDTVQNITATDKCLLFKNGDLTPVWILNFQKGDFPYSAYVSSEEIIQVKPRFMEIDGRSKIWDTNPMTGKLASYTLNNMHTNGTLTNSYFTTATPNGRVSESTHVYEYDPADPRFEEASVFTNANRMMEFYESIGYRETSPNRTFLVLSEDPQSANNAFYAPPSDEAPTPMIYVGRADGKTLRNTRVDADVIYHEYGHHITVRYVKEMSGESLIIHEGLADYFAFAKTGDPCLGESICPTGSKICFVPNQCLRTANNTFTIGDPNLPSEAHRQSQLLSGALWSMRGSLSGALKTELDKVVFKAIEFLPYNAG